MPAWGEILKELAETHEKQQIPRGISPFDYVRRKYLSALAQHTGRNVILYATKWTQGGADPESASITVEDVQGFMEVLHGLAGTDLDLILHSPGGSPEATEALVTYLRSKFMNVRVMIPHAAMSAATMLACSAERLVMGKHSFIGPIDPQFVLDTQLGRMPVPAHAIREQFEMAKEECRDQGLLPSWIPVLRQYGPALIIQCQLAIDLSQSLVGDWLGGTCSAAMWMARTRGELWRLPWPIMRRSRATDASFPASRPEHWASPWTTSRTIRNSRTSFCRCSTPQPTPSVERRR